MIGGGGIFSVPSRVVAGLDLGTQDGDVDEPFTGGLSGSAYPTVVLIEMAADLESQLEIVFEVPGNPSDSLQKDGYHTCRRWFALLE